MTKALTENWGNPSALYDFGIRAARELRTARHAVAAAMGAEPDRVFFTSGGTEATTGPCSAPRSAWASGESTSSPPLSSITLS